MHIGHYTRHIPLYLCICHGKKCVEAVAVRSSGSQGYESIHIRSPVDQPFKSTDKKLLVDHHNGCRQQKLDQAHGHMISFQECRNRPVPHHMSHGEIHQRDQETQRSDQPSLHLRRLPVF